MDNKSAVNKNLYKIFLILIKYLPLTLSLIQLGLTIMNWLGISAPLLICFGGSSLIFIVLLYLISYVFKYCYLFRMPLWYITIMMICNILRYLGFIPVDLDTLYRMYFFISGVFGISYIIVAYKNRNKPKVDPIKNFCERYCDCC